MPGTVVGSGKASGKANESRSCFHGRERPEGKIDSKKVLRGMIKEMERGSLTQVMSIWVSIQGWLGSTGLL